MMRRKGPIRWAAILSAPFVLLTAAAQSTPNGDEKRLIGRWVRPDGGYLLELRRRIGRDSDLQAAYFNPRPINVARAHFTRKDGKLMLFIELRDVNYPGSTYNLQYDSVADRLKGTYFQAFEKRTFRVDFIRAK